MKLLFIADGRSPTALNWISYFVDSGHEVHLASVFPCQPDLDLASLSIIPISFSSAAGETSQQPNGLKLKAKIMRFLSTPNIRGHLRHYLIPRSLPGAAAQLRSLILDIQPDLVHAMRIPYEGMLAALACSEANLPREIPLVMSVWGNDFTLHAPATRKMTQLTRFALGYADALHPDCHRDLRLAQEWGFAKEKPSMVLPGGGGVQADLFYVGDQDRDPIVINPRGMRTYVRNDIFFKAIPMILAEHPDARFLCPNMAGETQVNKWVDEYNVGHAVELLPRQSRTQMGELFRQAQIVVSPSTHDGTPNTILEALACGAFPVAGDIESLREWIRHGENGLLVDPVNPQALAEAVIEGLSNPGLRLTAQKLNTRLIHERAEFKRVMGEAEDFYRSMVGP
ncbi:MAG: glycosyltransferase [Chloroflexota bacterium]